MRCAMNELSPGLSVMFRSSIVFEIQSDYPGLPGFGLSCRYVHQKAMDSIA